MHSYQLSYVCITILVFLTTANEWVVYILNEGIGGNIRLVGLYVITICTSNSSFNIHDFYTGKLLLAWHKDEIRRSGCIGPLVFLEIKEKCHKGPGLLWMQHPTPQSVKLQEHIHK